MFEGFNFGGQVAYPRTDIGLSSQDLTKWNGDHALNGGNKEWAEEDGALHAFNMVRLLSLF